MKNKLDEIKSYIKDNQKKLGIAFLSLLGFCVIATGVVYLNNTNKKKEDVASVTLDDVKKEKQKEADKETKKETSKEVTKSIKKGKEKAKKTEEKTASKKEEEKQEENKTIVIESQAQKSEEVSKETKKNTTSTAKSTHQNKPVEVEKANTKVTENKPVETKPVESKKDPNAGKVWKEAEYKTVQVPAVTERRWIVDETAWTEQVDTGRGRIVHSDGFATENYDEADEYQKKKALEGKMLSYWVEPVYESVYHEEVGHWEDVIITPATTRQELVRPAGWY